MTVTAVPVDAEGLDVAAGVRSAAGAALAVLTPGQQAPLGMTMSLPRRLALLVWTRRNDAWIIEDDYLSELQLKGRAAPALASLDHGGAGAAHRKFQQDHQLGAAPGLSGRAAGTGPPVRSPTVLATPPTMINEKSRIARHARFLTGERE
jgi:hypothetical protein